jgi:hypothetical protein
LAKECREIAHVYKNGYCNIAALEATDSGGGCFSKRDPSLLKLIIIQSHWKGCRNGIWHWKFHRHLRHMYGAIDNSPVHRRGWVLQERLLSPRNLHFGEHMIYWECRHSIASENSIPREPNSGRRLIFQGESNIDMIAQDGYLKKWSSIVESFTSASLSYNTDKLVAISALAKEMQKIFDCGTKLDCNYLAGLWLAHLAQQLLWFSADPSLARRLHNGALTWLWASLDGPVRYRRWSKEKWDQNILIRIQKARAFDSGTDTFIEVTGGILELKCWLWEPDEA